jgi:hypothetical protein
VVVQDERDQVELGRVGRNRILEGTLDDDEIRLRMIGDALEQCRARLAIEDFPPDPASARICVV